MIHEIADHPGDSFEKVVNIDLTEKEQTPTESVSSTPSTGNLTGEEPRKKRVKTTAGRFDLPFVRKFFGLQSKSSPSCPKQPFDQPTRKSSRLASQTMFKPVQSSKDEPIVIEDIDSSTESTPARGSETASTEQGSPLICSSKSSLKRKATARKSTSQTPKSNLLTSSKKDQPANSPEEPQAKSIKTASAPPPNLEKFLQRSVVRGKILKIVYFQEQGLEVFLDKLRQHGWLELFTNTNLGCSVPDLAEFYARCSVTDGRLFSKVNGVKIEFDAQELGEILGIPATGFDIYVREDKFVLDTARLVELA